MSARARWQESHRAFNDCNHGLYRRLIAVKGSVALLGTGVVVLSLVFTIQPAWHLLEKGHGEGALLWSVGPVLVRILVAENDGVVRDSGPAGATTPASHVVWARGYP